MGETGSKTSISHREGITDHPSKDTLECGWQPVIRKVQPEENNLSPHPKNKKRKRKRTNKQTNKLGGVRGENKVPKKKLRSGLRKGKEKK
jgi:hypothetical protein